MSRSRKSRPGPGSASRPRARCSTAGTCGSRPRPPRGSSRWRRASGTGRTPWPAAWCSGPPRPSAWWPATSPTARCRSSRWPPSGPPAATGTSVLVGNLAEDGEDGAAVVQMLIDRRVDGVIAAAPQLEGDLEVAEMLRRYVPGGQPAPRAGRRRPAGGIEPPGRGPDRDRTPDRGWATPRSGPSPARSAATWCAAGCTATRTRCARPGSSRVRTWPWRRDWTPGTAAAATRLLLERAPRMTAIFVHSDTMAIGVLSALASAGRRVPADVAVVSCDDMPFAEYLRPSLSSLRVPFGGDRPGGRRTAAAQHRRGAGPGVHGAAAGRADRPRFLRRPPGHHRLRHFGGVQPRHPLPGASPARREKQKEDL